MDGADVCRTSRRPPDVISDLAILDPRWRGRKWRHPGPGARFSTPIAARGAKWRPFRFRSPSWMTSFAGTGNEVIQDGDRKRKCRHFAPRAAMGVEKRALYYFCVSEMVLQICFFILFLLLSDHPLPSSSSSSSFISIVIKIKCFLTRFRYLKGLLNVLIFCCFLNVSTFGEAFKF